MKLKTQLYIDTGDNPISDTPTYELVEFFDFESIEITSSIKTIQEVDKVFTDYTREFVVPASKNNNKIFQHFYYTKLAGGFDARIKRRARIFVNGVFFKQGYVRLQSSQVKDGYPYSYSLNFFGALSGLEDVIGEDELTSLDYLNKYDHTYSNAIVFAGLTSGLEYSSGIVKTYTGVSRDIVYPLISADDSLYYDSDGGTSSAQTFRNGTAINLYNDNGAGSPDSTKGVRYTHLKPAIKVSNIIDAITDKYESINFSDDSFIYKNQIKDLYLLLHNNKGILDTSSGDFEEQSARFDVNRDEDFTLSSGNNYRPLFTYSRVEGSQLARQRRQLDFNVTVNAPTSDAKYYVELWDDTKLLKSWETASTGTTTHTYPLESKDYKVWNDLYYLVKSDGGLTDFDSSLDVTTYYETVSAFSDGNLVEWIKDYKSTNITWNSNNEVTSYTGETGYNFINEIRILKHIPKMKIIDFLSGLFKMFNLVADVDKDTGEINVISLTDYYSNGTDRDITGYVDGYNYDVDRVQLYGKMDFKYAEPKTFGLLNHNEKLNDDFGNLSYPQDEDKGSFNLIFDKGDYSVELPFEKLYYERLSNIATITPPLEVDKLTDICWGWLADKDQNTTLTKPILFYNTNESVDTAKYKWGMNGQASFISTYNRAGNSNSDESYSLNFDTEKDEFSLNTVENSLFKLYYRGYVVNMFDTLARNVKIEARLPLSFLFEYKLNDRLLIDGVSFRINEITTNLNTGKSQLDLITDFGIVEEVVVDTTPPNQVTNVTLSTALSTGLEITWDETSDNVGGSGVTNYKIYVDGVLNKTVGVVTNARISGLSPSTSYDIQVRAVDANGNEGTLSTIVAMSTVATPTDVTPPSIPTNLRSTLIGSTAVTIEWDASTDDTAVNDYRVFVGGVFNQTVSGTSATIGSLSANTEYSFTVSARDAVPNESAQSAPLLVTTLTT